MNRVVVKARIPLLNPFQRAILLENPPRAESETFSYSGAYREGRSISERFLQGDMVSCEKQFLVLSSLFRRYVEHLFEMGSLSV